MSRASGIVTSQQIQERGIATVQDVLHALAGVSVYGSSNTFTQVRTRGGEANDILILIDGIEAAGGNGEYVLSALETANIEHIEVLRGLQPAYYGSNASARVISIITLEGGIGRTYSASLEVGNTTTATAFVSHHNERGGLSFSFSHTDDPGYGQSGDGGEKDGLERTTGILSGDYLLTYRLKLGFTLRRSEEEYNCDSTSATAMDAAR